MSAWVRTSWWRVTCATAEKYPVGYTWCETTNEREARAALATCPGGGVLERLWQCADGQWRATE